MARRIASPSIHIPQRLAKETRSPSGVHGSFLSGLMRATHNSCMPSRRIASGGSCSKRQATTASTTSSFRQCTFTALLGGAGDGLRDGVLELANGRRLGDGELKGLGLCSAPGGARGWPVGQELK